MLHRVLAIALNTYRESLRARILLGLAGVAFAVSLYSLVVGSYTLRNAPRVVSDLGVASISLFGLAVAIVICSTSLYRELEQKTLFPILARPIRRGEYLAGKYLGTLLTILVFVMADAGLVLLLDATISRSLDPAQVYAASVRAVVTGIVLVALLAVPAWRWARARTYGVIPWSALVLVAGIVASGVAPDERRVVLAGSALAFLEIAIVAAIGMLFSSFSTPFLSALLTVWMFLLGRSADTMSHYPAKFLGPGFSKGMALLAKVTPNLHLYVPPRPLLSGEAVGEPLGSYLLMAAVMALGWVVGLMAVASVIFKRRDFL